MNQEHSKYTLEENQVWSMLFNRQREQLKKRACESYNTCLDKMQPCLNKNTIPNFKKINEFFKHYTGWEIHVVPGLIPVEEFFDLLADKKFCSSTWLRSRNQIDYLEEPDMFHDVFGHIPLLLNPTFSKFAQEFGKLGQIFKGNEEMVLKLQRIYWFTIEFGLIREQDELKIYGAGIASSFGETIHVFSSQLECFDYNIEEVMDCEFYTDKIQEKYFIINSFKDLLKSLEKINTKQKKTA